MRPLALERHAQVNEGAPHADLHTSEWPTIPLIWEQDWPRRDLGHALGLVARGRDVIIRSRSTADVTWRAVDALGLATTAPT